METRTITEAVYNLDALLHATEHDHQRTLITDDAGAPLAVMLPIQDFELLGRIETMAHTAVAHLAYKEMADSPHGETISLEEARAKLLEKLKARGCADAPVAPTE
jgi:PHD/YefM family antitoxin component YafN of YafNO toxin-antitoxin module